jgi:hypothetical protein
MLRFSSNRWWVFILALALFLVCGFLATAQAPRVANATAIIGEEPSDSPDPGGGSIGDPDVPITPGAPKPGKAVSRGNLMQQGNALQGPVLEGERAMPSSASVWVMRLRLYLMGLRTRLLVF